MSIAHGAPPKHRHIYIWVVCRHMKVRDAVVSVRRAFDCCLIDAVLNQHCSKRSPGNQRLSDDDMAPRCRHSIRPDADLDAMRVHRTIVTAAHIILTRPNELNRRATQTLRNHSRFALDVRVDYGAPAKTAAGKFSVESNLFRF